MKQHGRTFAAVMVMVGVFAGGCGVGDETAAPPTTQPGAFTTTSTTAVTSTTTAPVTTTTPAAPRTTTSSARPTGPATTVNTSPSNPTPAFRTPEDAATHLYAAWQSGDRTKAALSGQPAAVNFLFALPAYPGGFAMTGCSFRDVGYDCRFEGAADAVVMRVQGGAATGWRVTSGSLRS